MYKDGDFDLGRPLPWNAAALKQDLELNTLFNVMALGDRFLFDVAQRAVLASECDLETIRYRQDILRDCLKNAGIVSDIYAIAVEADEGHRKLYWAGRHPGSILWGAVDLLQFLVGVLKKLRRIADSHAAAFESEGFSTLFAVLTRELSDEYFVTVERHLKHLQFRHGVLISAKLGRGNKGSDYVLRQPNAPERSWLERIFTPSPPAFSYQLQPRDDAGARALSALRDQGVNFVANATAQSVDHILGFFNLLRTELGFYVGCTNLYKTLANKDEAACFPEPLAEGMRSHSFRGLYDVCLTLSMPGRVVANDVAADGRDAAIITGANRGGKSTFLRSIGVAQLMMQCGMFVGAQAFSANVCSGVFSHYKREEDPSMKSGKFDEELTRMSEIADHVKPNALLLFNESFAATNDREGSEIARQIVSALLEKKIKVFFVTHLYEFTRALWENRIGCPIFLRAERQPDGTRTFELVEAEPLETSYGEDLYKEIFLGGRAEAV